MRSLSFLSTSIMFKLRVCPRTCRGFSIPTAEAGSREGLKEGRLGEDILEDPLGETGRKLEFFAGACFVFCAIFCVLFFAEAGARLIVCECLAMVGLVGAASLASVGSERMKSSRIEITLRYFTSLLLSS